MQQPYPSHIMDPQRVRIAVSYLKHEQRKLLPHIRDPRIWQEIDEDISAMPSRLMAHSLIRDFWNYVHGVAAGYKLKCNLVPSITSANINWFEREISLEEIRFLGMDGFPGEGIEQTAAQARDWIHGDGRQNLLTKALHYSREERTDTASRDHFPLILRERDGLFDALDGSGRIVKAILCRQERLMAFAGRVIGSPLYQDHWVPTSTLTDIVMANRNAASAAASASYAVAIADMIRDSVVARREFAHRAVVRADKNDKLLLEFVARLMPEHAEEFIS